MRDKKYLDLNGSVYLSCLDKSSDSHLSVNWGSKESQEKRFEVLMNISQDFIESSIIDVGCGLGHFADFIKDRKFLGAYYGIDILNEMIKNAQKRHPELIFKNSDLSSCDNSSYDYVIMSGIFTLANLMIYQKEINNAFRVCKKGIAFNTLSSWAIQKEKGEFYADPLKTLEFCAKLTSKVVLRHDYLPHDFTIYMYKA